MLVDTWMSRDPFTVDVDATVGDAVTLMTTHRLRRLPVVRAGHVVGIVTKGDLRRGQAIDPFSVGAHQTPPPPRSIHTVMVSPVVTTTPTVPIEDAAAVMLDRKVGALPVVRTSGSLVGILTTSDTLRALIASLVVPGRCMRLVFDGADPDGLLAFLVARTRPLKLSIASVLQTTGAGGREMVVTVVGGAGAALADAAWAAGYRVKSVTERQG